MSLILIIDDHPLDRYVLASLMSDRHEVEEAMDEVEALERAHARPPDLIVAPGDSALVRALRSDPRLARIPLILHTSRDRERETREIAAEAGASDVITKPWDPTAVLAVISPILGVSLPPPDVYIEWLRTAVMRMSALLELCPDLNAERDAGRLMAHACRSLRAMFAADAAIVALPYEGRIRTWMDEPALAADRADDLLTDLLTELARDAGASPRRSSDPHDPAVAALRRVLPQTVSALLVPMAISPATYGFVILVRGAEGGAFTEDDERFAVAVASVLRTAHANRMLAREDLRALFNASPLAIAAYDRDGLVRAWSGAAERIFGWNAEEVIGRPCPILAPEDVEEREAMADACLRGKVLTNVEVRRMRRDGTMIDMSASMAPLYDADGAARGYVVTLSDISAMKNVEIELRASRERLRALSARVLSIQEEERTRIARELHDELGQFLTAIKMDVARLLRAVERGTPPEPDLVARILPLIDTTMVKTGSIVSELRPSRVAEMGLASAVEMKLSDFRSRYGVETELFIRTEALDVRPDVGIAAFRILEEALTNVARHSGATRTEVRLHQHAHELVLEIRDNGRGIRELERTAPNAYGVIGMKERAYALGGDVEIRAVDGVGTTVTARIPLVHDRT
ncbi:MAG TPA: PAS domain S-box protein [Thermoanaerobaculia bacterium]|nr:PAS domain S-box protein [Thermoanaerobaculia bacterium]